MIKHQAVYNTHSTVVSLSGDGLTALDINGNSVTLDQTLVDAEAIRLQGVYDGNAYQRTRATAYAELKEQLDLLYHDMTADKGDKTGTWYASVKAVKDATPKP
jgi:hypothetical protein